MTLALVAQDAKKGLMQNFCIAYRNILSRHELFATGTTGRLVEEATGLTVRKFQAGPLGGAEQLCSRIEHNEIDLVLCLYDPDTPRTSDAGINVIGTLCDRYNIPCATNLASAELMIKALERGDLEWREMYH